MQARLARIATLQRQVAALQAEQVALTASYVDEWMRYDEEHGFVSGRAQYRAMVAEVAIAKRVSVTTAAGFMDDAWGLTRHHPATMRARPRPAPWPSTVLSAGTDQHGQSGRARATSRHGSASASTSCSSASVTPTGSTSMCKCWPGIDRVGQPRRDASACSSA